ncbi:hypothetical protein BO94DRAFT_570462 [Aspergillus sclerotioniger CBS 115572]|uniref:Uncharacterized protein n=1 Tax=Aspergillus sclerotioniger CBS 115572 TaxID=1450535 RepID=A0A317UW50_9EURO|nr:hypothetical protein BO94DRAFT_570462 [Aspergillus sclerotioniger CBS 115572]PWY64727.1 hypothetical protein BO94DRAFT_570462 [Aspergillus sclerotioniger CBS 115572]
MTYLTPWHPVYNVPIVGGMFQNPTTGSIHAVTNHLSISGPPSVFVAVADHVRDKAYTIKSINASPYDLTVVCWSDLTQEAMSELVFQMKADLGKDVHMSPEEVADFETFVEEERKKENPRF